MSWNELSSFDILTDFFLILGQSYKHVLGMLSKISLSEEQTLRFDRALKGFHSLKKVSAEIAAEFKLQNKLNLVWFLYNACKMSLLWLTITKNKFTCDFQELDAVMKYQDLQSTLRNLSDVLFMPETFEHTGKKKSKICIYSI